HPPRMALPSQRQIWPSGAPGIFWAPGSMGSPPLPPPAWRATWASYRKSRRRPRPYWTPLPPNPSHCFSWPRPAMPPSRKMTMENKWRCGHDVQGNTNKRRRFDLDPKALIKRFYEEIVSKNLLEHLPEYVSQNCLSIDGAHCSPLGVDGMRQHLLAVRST